MTKYRIQFAAIVEREVEVPDGLLWWQAYEYVRNTLDWYDIAHSAAAEITIDTSRTVRFDKLV